MQADYDARLDSGGAELNWETYSGYHEAAFALSGVDAEAWTAHVPLALMDKVNPAIADEVWYDLLANQGFFDAYTQGSFMMAGIPISGDQSPSKILADYTAHAQWMAGLIMTADDLVLGALSELMASEDCPVFWQRAAALNDKVGHFLNELIEDYKWGFQNPASVWNEQH